MRIKACLASRQSTMASLLLLLVICLPGTAQTVWNTGSLTFTKNNNADWTIAANQDRITPKVWITRANNEGIFNILNEPAYLSSSPTDTEWADGSINNYSSLTYKSWFNWYGKNPAAIVNREAVLHLVSENIYIGIKFNSWTQSAAGGGFSYTRTTQSSLPVKLLYFNVRLREPAVEISWATSQEQNSAFFNVQYSSDGINYSTINTIPAAGNSSEIRYYSCRQTTVPAGVNYYRLQQADLDGSLTYSNTVMVKGGKQDDDFILFPNPAKDYITLSTKKGFAMEVKLYAHDGRLLRSQLYNSNPVKMDVSALPRGAYYISVQTAGTNFSQKFIKP